MDIQTVKWEHYPRVAAHPVTRSFVERLALKGKRPKTIDDDGTHPTPDQRFFQRLTQFWRVVELNDSPFACTTRPRFPDLIDIDIQQAPRSRA